MRRSCESLLCLLGACGAEVTPPGCVTLGEPTSLSADNVVIVLLDDIGAEKVASYGLHPTPAPTPTLDALAARSVRFTSAYAEPLCSPTRAALLTGRRPTRTGVGSNLFPVDDSESPLPLAETTLPEAVEALALESRASMVVGKWHLSSWDALGPLHHGFDDFDGLLGNPDHPAELDGEPTGYTHWEHRVGTGTSVSTEYLTTVQVDAAIAAVQTLPEPFLLYVALSGAHGPLHVPPADLFDQAVPHDDAGIGDAMIEATDRELGRLVEAVGDRAVLIVTADNGTSEDFVRAPSPADQAKGSVYPGGTHVPLLISGPGIDAGVFDGLVHVLDVFPTVLDLVGLDARELGIELDGTSLVPALRGRPTLRTCAVVERFKPGYDAAAAIDIDYWLVRPDLGVDQLYRRVPSGTPLGPDLLQLDPVPVEAEIVARRLRRAF